MRLISVLLLTVLASACAEDSGAEADAASAAEAARLSPATVATASAPPASASVQKAPRGAAAADSTGEPVRGLPLELGFYITADTACSEASNATLQLLRRGGVNTSRGACDFTRVERTGPDRYRVTQSCTEEGEAWGMGEQATTSTSTYIVLDRTSFRVIAESGYETRMKHCPQRSLPEPWRGNDIGSIIAE